MYLQVRCEREKEKVNHLRYIKETLGHITSVCTAGKRLHVRLTAE